MSINFFNRKEIKCLQKLRKKLNQRGFTLLELLVVVAILAAIAGTATIALKDTDARASAAAHVTMMDELNKGISTYRVLQRNTLPNRLDSLMMYGGTGHVTVGAAAPLSILGFTAADTGTYTNEDAATLPIPAGVQTIMSDAGITELRYVNDVAANNPDGDGNCGDIKALVENRGNNVVAGNIFLSASANGCGVAQALDGTATPMGMFWVGGQERLTGQPFTVETGTPVEFDGTNLATANSPAYLLTGIGPSSTLFDANTLGGMTTVPVYRHVKPNEYNRFVAVWNVGDFDGAGAITAKDQIELVAIVDGALDTKEEELGEWDGTRNTI
ncbi:type II secretion system protein [Pelobacter propionicus]|uniref:Prepilin-type N-terminal cleavage/methylation domain-containing protein n=1 Tax=Pelobacter propionicus (strain DSM 2379 / NBRC 103807 / OttBd1) TaxID=338966 RepID=A1AM67_PELPD|nr:type II secretion system protein [Pelobacter propionicus]ABK98437.1 hypothetical protein Ppro_0807 [Pelobacter propionicus DSM 2379]